MIYLFILNNASVYIKNVYDMFNRWDNRDFCCSIVIIDVSDKHRREIERVTATGNRTRDCYREIERVTATGK